MVKDGEKEEDSLLENSVRSSSLRNHHGRSEDDETLAGIRRLNEASRKNNEMLSAAIEEARME